MKNKLRGYEIASLIIIALWIITALLAFMENDGVAVTIQFIAALISGLICAVYFYFRRTRDLKVIRQVSRQLKQSERKNIDSVPMPVLVLDGSMNVMWFNAEAENLFFKDGKAGTNVKDLLRGFSLDTQESGAKQSVSVNDHGYTVYTSELQTAEQTVYVLYFHDDDELKHLSAEYYNSRPVVMIITIDNYDELLRDARDLERTKILAGVEETILHWVTRTTGMLLRYDREKYIFTMEERDFRKLRDNKFDILDDVRKQVRPDGTYPTLSIGVGHGYDTFRAAEKAARQALDVALGRGGDQAAVCTNSNDTDSYEFYGGVTKGIERNSKVRSRVVAANLEVMIKQASNVLIVGHQRSDMDSVGAAVGVQFIAVGLGREAKVVVNRETSLAATLIDHVESSGLDIFVSPSQAKKMLTPESIVVVVDNQRLSNSDAPDIIEAAQNTVVIDHHRRAADSIQNPAILFNEPNSSSTCEMVVELIQYMSCGKPNKVQSEALLSGIVLDTKNYTVNTGVRTFEAASYLRRRGVDTAAVKHLFNEPFEIYALKNKFLGNMINYHTVVFALLPAPSTASYVNKSASMAADELAQLEKVEAAFAVYSTGDQVVICARSAGGLNVQLIMERFGGGGHHNVAGAQIRNSTVDEVLTRLKYAVDQTLIEAKQNTSAE